MAHQRSAAATILSRHGHVQGAQPVMPEYRPEDMVFEMEEEKIPVYNPPKPDDEDEDDEVEAAATEQNGDASATGCWLCQCILLMTSCRGLHNHLLLETISCCRGPHEGMPALH